MELDFNPIEGLLSQGRQFGLTLDSSNDEIKDAFGEPCGGWEFDPVIQFGDLEIAPSGKDYPRLAYFAIYPGKNNDGIFSIGTLFNQPISDGETKIEAITNYFDRADIKYVMNSELAYKNEQRCIETELGDQLFFMSNDEGESYLLQSAFQKRM